VAWSLIDLILTLSGSEQAARESGMAVGSMFRDVLGAAVWTAYIVRSQRVAATFTRDASTPPAAATPEPASA
jgi:hypothetical protein